MTYKKLIQYAKRINGEDYMDLAHGYFLYNLERGRNILTEKYSCRYNWIALKHFNLNMIHRHKYFISRGTDRKRVLIGLPKIDGDNFVRSYNSGPNNTLISAIKDHVERRASKTRAPKIYREILELYPMGYESKEIAEMLNVTTRSVEHKRLRIKQWINQYKN